MQLQMNMKFHLQVRAGNKCLLLDKLQIKHIPFHIFHVEIEIL